MSSRVFSDVSIDILDRIAARDDAAGFEFRIDDDHRSGTVAGTTPLGEVEASFDFVADRAELAVTILRKPPFLPTALLWSEFARAIERARAESEAGLAANGAGA
ncbi:hypothetical protein GCM10011320_32560 [Neoroseomonas lacus]|uniref:Uncharacterized protein n=1 Tax=Neoroseomonas lacus TaxID=287609 RepID=A0A917NRG5_9PROT|nr:hypothetical protein GCM10011320_32560 [Neoroseomonas lacus]